MTNSKTIARFPFVVNKSFCSGSRPITIPSRFYPELKENGITDAVRVKISFQDKFMLEGNLRAGFRAGGKYYQLTIIKSVDSESINVAIGSTLGVRILKDADSWNVVIS